MKICFSGAHRTGKTSLAERIAVDNSFIMYYTNVSSTFRKRSVKEMEQESSFYERLLQQENIRDHIVEQFERGESYSVFDRSPIDVSAYSEYYLGKLISSEQEIKDYNSHLNLIRAQFNLVDFTFIVQPGVVFEDVDSSASKETQYAMNEVFLNTIDMFVPKHKYTIINSLTTDFEERVRFCQGHIDNLLKS